MGHPASFVPNIGTDQALAVAKQVAVFVVRRKLLKAVPVLGVAVAAVAGVANIRRKGWLWGSVDTALDLTPFVGRAKAAYEFFGGDIIAPTRA